MASLQAVPGTGGTPVWFNQQACNMKLLARSLANELCIIRNNASEIIVHRQIDGCFVVYWRIMQNAGLVKGAVSMTRRNLMRAFAAMPMGSEQVAGKELAKRYGADAAEPGQFIRAGFYLNIPGPGTGLNGDPNISCLINEGIRDAVLALCNNPY